MQSTAGGEPDVSVIVAVYNTMPYLTECLNSLVEQSIGTGRMEVVAVDDGSTDGSGKELDRFAERYPGVFTVVHQENSGGPAAPSNRALDLARGRYVFFVGADDHLGSEALERLVDAADRLDSDVVLGKMVGVGGRDVPGAVFERSSDDVTFLDSALAWAISNTKLFRRAHIEELGLRFDEDLPVLSDEPFTMEACFRARRVSVRADYDYYFAVRRADESNVTLSFRREDWLRATARAMAVTQRHTEPGRGRDWIHRRHCTSEMARILAPGFLDLPRDVRGRLCDGLGELVRLYCNDYVMARLTPVDRLCLRLAGRGAADAVAEVLRCPEPPLHLDGARAYAAYPSFRDPRLGLPDSWFDITRDVLPRWSEQTFAPAGVRWGEAALEVGTVGSLPDLTTFGADCVTGASELRGPDGQGERPLPVEFATHDEGTAVRLRVPLGELFPRQRAPWSEATIRVRATALDVTHDIPLPADLPARRHWHRLRPYDITAHPTDRGALTLRVTPVPVGQLVLRRARRHP